MFALHLGSRTINPKGICDEGGESFRRQFDDCEFVGEWERHAGDDDDDEDEDEEEEEKEDGDDGGDDDDDDDDDNDDDDDDDDGLDLFCGGTYGAMVMNDN